MRAVYYDPFGQRTEGYRAGVQDEVTLQDQTRRARGSDFDFDYYNPLRLAQAQRMDTLGKAALPYQIADLGIQQRSNLANLYPQESMNYQEIGRATGNYAPYLAGAEIYGSGQSLGSERYFPGMVRRNFDMFQSNDGQGPANYGTPEYFGQLEQQFGLPAGSFQQFAQSLTGRVGPGSERGADEFFNREDIRQSVQDQWDMNQDMWQREVERQRAQQAYDQSQALNNYYMYGPGYMNPATGMGAGTTGATTVDEYVE